MVIEDRLLSPGSSHGRSGRALTPQGIVIHYIGNAGSSALANRNWFENGSGDAHVSVHYIVGLNGEVLRCVPDNECAAHAGKSYGAAWNDMSKTNNSRFLGIETCHPLPDGKFTETTIASLAELTAGLCIKHKLDPEKDVYRHYDVCGKMCPLYYVNNAAEWVKLKNRVVGKYAELKGAAAPAGPPAPAAEPSATGEPSSWAAETWGWAKENGITDGTRPKDALTREEGAKTEGLNWFWFLTAQNTGGQRRPSINPPG